jgi:positive regulator of sigma E activity
MNFKMGSLHLYYTSMIIYMIDAIPLILYTLVIKPIANLYHEPISTMVSPVFGNYGFYLDSLFFISLALTTVSLMFFVLAWNSAIKSGKTLSAGTKFLPVVLFIFAYSLLGVSGLA